MQFSSMNNKRPYAIVIGLDHINGIQTARILARKHVPVIGVAKDPKHYCCKTRVCDQILVTEAKAEPLINTLATFGRTLEEKAVLFPCTDTHVLLVSRFRHVLEHWYHIVLPEPGVVEMMIDKVQFYTYAQKNGFPIAPTRFLKNRDQAEEAARELSFPCILKPPISALPEWEQKSKFKAYFLSNATEFLAAYDRFSGLTEVLIAQEWIKGPSSNLYSCNCYFNKRSELMATFIARKLRQWPPDTGESCLGEESRNDAVLRETIQLFHSVQFRGLGYLEMKRDECTGKHFIVEPNIGRPTGRSAIAEAGGVDLIYSMYCDALGWPLPSTLEQRYANVKWVYLRRDLQSAFYGWRRGNLTIRAWWRSFRGRKTYALFSWSDPLPFLGDLQRAIRLYLSPVERKKRDYRDLF